MFVKHIRGILLYFLVIEVVMCQESECFTRDGSEGVCVRIDECPSIKSILNNSARPLPTSVVNILTNHRCGFEDDMRTPTVCCLDDVFKTGATVTHTPPTISSINLTNSVDTQIDNRLPDDASAHPNLKLLPKWKDCGDHMESKLSNGNKTDLSEFPWMALLRYNDGGNEVSLCGGSLISELYVLTAAHCVKNLKSTITLVGVRLGEYDTTTEIDCQTIGTETTCAEPVQDIPIEKTFVHPNYSKYSNDIALIRLARPANLSTDSVKPICLPTTFQLQNTTLKRVLVTGWGTTETQRPATVLLQAALPIVPNDICQTQFYKRSLRLTSSQMCAGGETGIDSCKGDSGGPLTYHALGDARLVQFGIVSAGVSVCTNTNNFPGIYTKVGYYMRWILDQMTQ